MDLRGEKFERGGSNTKWRIVSTKFLQGHGLAHGLFPEPSAPLKRLRRARHALLGQLGSEDRSACGTGRGAAFPHRQFTHPCDTQGQVGDHGQRDGVAHLGLIEAQHLSCCTRCTDDTKNPLVPAQLSSYDLIRETTKDFIRQDNGGNHCTSVTPKGVSQGQGCGNHVTRMSTAGSEIGIVTVKIAHHHPVSEACHIGRAGVTSAQQTRW